MLKTYTYDLNTKEFLHESEPHLECDGTYTLNASNDTWVAPPECGDCEIPIYNIETNTWSLVPDYRYKIDEKTGFCRDIPYYIPSELWWAQKNYMYTYGDMPDGVTLEKMAVPQIVLEENAVDDEINSYRKYLSDTDYVNNVIAEEPEKREKYADTIEERKRVRALIDPRTQVRDELRSQIAQMYGEEALQHLRDNGELEY